MEENLTVEGDLSSNTDYTLFFYKNILYKNIEPYIL